MTTHAGTASKARSSCPGPRSRHPALPRFTSTGPQKAKRPATRNGSHLPDSRRAPGGQHPAQRQRTIRPTAFGDLRCWHAQRMRDAGLVRKPRADRDTLWPPLTFRELRNFLMVARTTNGYRHSSVGVASKFQGEKNRPGGPAGPTPCRSVLSQSPRPGCRALLSRTR